MGSAQTGLLMQVGQVRIVSYDRSRSIPLRRLNAENVCLSATVVRVHDGALTG